uniref:Alpha-galactosidase n=1 Tax=Opuntia streptacantha TaxID=393608 RepID=A0A7C9AV69_OPUST
MKFFFSGLFSLLLLLLLLRVAPEGLCSAEPVRAVTPPRGWNSYDSFCWTISEEEFLQNAELVSQRLRDHGYEYVVVDYLWYRRKVPGAYTDSSGFDVIDEWGRVIPDPDRWPSSRGGKGFTEVAKKVHSLGLKFGIHVMRGISTQAVNANTPILDTTKKEAYVEGERKWTASDIGMKERACAWMPHGFMSVNTKNDCVFGDDLDIEEITYVSEILRKIDRPILYSLSPGTSATPAMAREVSGLVNMYRVTGDDWDTWRDVAAHFDVARDFAAAKMIGSGGLKGKSWPDLDMLPLGWLTDPGTNQGPHRQCNLNINEQKTQMTLWAMVKSPLMFGGDMRKLDDATYNLITNPIVLEINAFSSNNKEFPFVTASYTSKRDNQIISQFRHNGTVGRSYRSSLALVSCKEPKAKGWAIEAVDEDLDQVCWKRSSETPKTPTCLYRRKRQVALGEEMVDMAWYQGKTHLLVSMVTAVCIEASPKRRLTSKEFKRGSLSRCKWDANQMWEIGVNGTLMNSYSSLCATVQQVKGSGIPEGIRAWVATGRQGEVYLAFFNLNQGKTVISADLSRVEDELPGVKLGDSCRCTEVWTRQGCPMTGGSVSMAVEAHGAALLVLNCNPA